MLKKFAFRIYGSETSDSSLWSYHDFRRSSNAEVELGAGVIIVTVMESRFPAMQVLWLGREFYKVKHGVTSATLVARMTLATNLATILATNRLFPKMQPFSRYFY
ncbi:hypothetical protein AVEN_119646-1 [Araneus ventricosus]|uniref:Uncharacterized protein n=1 Tax=Araneus ventricosus TaxID=182803 RepID=A0A4Y2WQH0_ARAVE|nr:hypothetical protein AVEN_119646-1 [Araneus ventricosus]